MGPTAPDGSVGEEPEAPVSKTNSGVLEGILFLKLSEYFASGSSPSEPLPITTSYLEDLPSNFLFVVEDLVLLNY